MMKVRVPSIEFIKDEHKEQFKKQLDGKYGSRYADRLQRNNNKIEIQKYISELKDFFEPLGYDLSHVEKKLLNIGHYSPLSKEQYEELSVMMKEKYPEIVERCKYAYLNFELGNVSQETYDAIIECEKMELEMMKQFGALGVLSNVP